MSHKAVVFFLCALAVGCTASHTSSTKPFNFGSKEPELPLNLEDRARRATNALAGAMDPAFNDEIFFSINFNESPPRMSHDLGSLSTNTAKFAESLTLMRRMTGEQRPEEETVYSNLLSLTRPDGLLYVPVANRPWTRIPMDGLGDGATEDFANIYGNSRWILALIARYEEAPTLDLKDQIDAIVAALIRIAIYKNDYAYYPEAREGEMYSYPVSGWRTTAEPADKQFGLHMYIGGSLRALAKWYELTGHAGALTLAQKLAAFVVRADHWDGPGGRFSGHFHAHTATLRGLLELGIASGRDDLKQFAKSGYEFAKTTGIPEIGYFPEIVGGEVTETCSVADMVALAARLSESEVGDYWDDVDAYTRNQLAENQLLRKDFLEQISARSPRGPFMPLRDSTDHVIERNLGSFVGRGGVSDHGTAWVMHCCTGNGSQALYYAWESILKSKPNGEVDIRLLMSRCSPEVDIESRLPLEGRVEFRVKTATSLRIRMPSQTGQGQIRIQKRRDGSATQLPIVWDDGHLRVQGLQPGDVVELEQPLQNWTKEITWAGKTYTLDFIGATAMSVGSLVPVEPSYPTYLR